MSMTEEHVAVAAKTGAVITQVASAGTLIFGLTLNEWGVLVGIVTAILGLIMQWYFGNQKLKNQREAYAQAGNRAYEIDTGKSDL